MRRLLLLAVVVVAAGCGPANGGRPESSEESEIVLSGVVGTGGDYHAVDPGTGTPRRLSLTRATTEIETVTLSPDGQYLGYYKLYWPRGEEWGEDQIFVSGIEGDNWRRLPIPTGGAHSPTVAPGGQRVALIFTPDPFEGPWNVWSAPTDDAGIEQLQASDDFEQLSSTGGAEDLAWSPDGRHIAFMDRPVVDADGALDPTGYIYVIGADGSGERRVVHGSGPDWSPDGAHIAFADDERRISVIDSGGGTPRVVAADGRDPVWSPDGKQLAFLRTTTCGHATCREGLFVVDVDGGKARRIGPELELFEPTLVAWTTTKLPGR